MQSRLLPQCYGDVLAERVCLGGGQGEESTQAVANFKAEGNGPVCGVLAGKGTDGLWWAYGLLKDLWSGISVSGMTYFAQTGRRWIVL